MSLISLSVFLSSLQRLCFLKIPAAISQIWWSNFYWLGGRHRRQPDGKAIVLQHRKHKRKCKIGSEIFHIAQTALTAQFWSAMETIMRSVMGLVMGKSISHWIGCCVRHRVSQGVRKRLNIWIYVFTAFLFAVLLLISANIWQFQSYVIISSALHEPSHWQRHVNLRQRINVQRYTFTSAKIMYIVYIRYIMLQSNGQLVRITEVRISKKFTLDFIFATTSPS